MYQYNKKWQKYGSVCQEKGIVFHPVPLETLGEFGESSTKQITRLGQSLARARGEE